eukprot:PhM_4_TR14007/c0_g1_i1/m.86748
MSVPLHAAWHQPRAPKPHLTHANWSFYDTTPRGPSTLSLISTDALSREEAHHPRPPTLQKQHEQKPSSNYGFTSSPKTLLRKHGPTVPRSPKATMLRRQEARVALGLAFDTAAHSNARQLAAMRGQQGTVMTTTSKLIHNPPYQELLKDAGKNDLAGRPWWMPKIIPSQSANNNETVKRKSDNSGSSLMGGSVLIRSGVSEVATRRRRVPHNDDDGDRLPEHLANPQKRVNEALGRLDSDIRGLARTSSIQVMEEDDPAAVPIEDKKKLNSMYRSRGGGRVVDVIERTSVEDLQRVPDDVMTSRTKRLGAVEPKGMLGRTAPRGRDGLLDAGSDAIRVLREEQRRAEAVFGLVRLPRRDSGGLPKITVAPTSSSSARENSRQEKNGNAAVDLGSANMCQCPEDEDVVNTHM